MNSEGSYSEVKIEKLSTVYNYAVTYNFLKCVLILKKAKFNL